MMMPSALLYELIVQGTDVLLNNGVYYRKVHTGLSDHSEEAFLSPQPFTNLEVKDFITHIKIFKELKSIMTDENPASPPISSFSSRTLKTTTTVDRCYVPRSRDDELNDRAAQSSIDRPGSFLYKSPERRFWVETKHHMGSPAKRWLSH